MEHFLATILVELSPQNIFGLIGGLLGGIAASDKTKYGKQLTIIAIIMSAVAGGAVTDHLVDSYNYKNIFALMIFSCILGMPVGSIMDAITIFNPEFSKRLVRLFGKKTIDRLDKII